MIRSPYPAECPVFEVTVTKYPFMAGIVAGDHIECAPTSVGKWLEHQTFFKGQWWNGVLAYDDVRPLTRSARQMLALVKP